LIGWRDDTSPARLSRFPEDPEAAPLFDNSAASRRNLRWWYRTGVVYASLTVAGDHARREKRAAPP
jgi:hypothetical protein